MIYIYHIYITVAWTFGMLNNKKLNLMVNHLLYNYNVVLVEV